MVAKDKQSPPEPVWTLLYTTCEYLLQAATLNDLVVHSDEHDSLWHALRDWAKADRSCHADLPDVDLPPKVLASGMAESTAGYEA